MHYDFSRSLMSEYDDTQCVIDTKRNARSFKLLPLSLATYQNSLIVMGHTLERFYTQTLLFFFRECCALLQLQCDNSQYS